MRARIGRKISGNFRKKIEREIRKYRGDHFLWHKHVTGINLNPHQVLWMNEMDRKGDSHMLIGSRRIRKSFTVAAYYLEEAACLPYSEVNVHSPALEQSKRNLRYMHDMVMNSELLLAYVDQRLGEGLGKEHIEFMNRSLIQAKGQASSVDGLGATHQWLEEFDDMDWETFLTRIYPTGSQIKDDHHYERHKGCCRVITGTIKGIGNIYAIEHPEKRGVRFNVLPKLNCFVPDTLILTSNGPKEIAQVEIDDLVQTDQGCWRPVKQLHVNDYEGDLVKITIAYSSGLSIRCTPNHKFFTERGSIRADELSTSDILLINDTTPETPKPETEFEITLEMSYLMGLYLADGWIDRDGYTCEYVFNISKRHHLEKAIRCLEACNIKYRQVKSDITNSVSLFIHSKKFSHHLNKYCGRLCRTKFVHPCIENLSHELRRQFIIGYFMGDGCEEKVNGRKNRISAGTVNQGIAASISRMMARLGVRPTVTKSHQYGCMINGRYAKGSDIWSIQTSRWKSIDDIGLETETEQKFKTGQIRKIEREAYSGKVYNLGVEDIHSYTLATCAVKVHNCWHGVAMNIIPENDIKLFQALSTPHQFARTYLVLYVESSAFYPDKWVRNCADNEYVPVMVIDDPKVQHHAIGDVTIGIDCAGAGSGQEASNWAVTFTEKIGNQVYWLYSEEWPANERPDVVQEKLFRLITYFRPVNGFGDAFDVAFLYDLNRRLYNESITRIDVRRFENKAGKNGWDEWFIKPLRFTGPTKHLMHERMQKYVYGTYFKYPALVDDDVRYTVLAKLIKQFGNVKAERGPSGYNKYSMLSDKLGDDLIDSLIASVWAQEEIKVLFAPVGGFIPPMSIGDRKSFPPLGPKFLNDRRKFNSPQNDAGLYDFLKSD